MRNLIFIVFSLIVCVQANATEVIARHSNGQTFYYYHSLADADENILGLVLSDAINGDTIYLPGVEYVISNDLIIDKRIVLIGTGIHPDSTTLMGAQP